MHVSSPNVVHIRGGQCYSSTFAQVCISLYHESVTYGDFFSINQDMTNNSLDHIFEK